MVAQPTSFPVADPSAETDTETVVTLWAVFNALDTVPATPETQLAFEQARSRVQERILAAGIDTRRINDAFRSLNLPRPETRGDPQVSL